MYELLGCGSSLDALKHDLQAAAADQPEHFGQWEQSSFKVIVDTWGHATTMQEQVELIEELDFLPFKAHPLLAGLVSWSACMRSIPGCMRAPRPDTLQPGAQGPVRLKDPDVTFRLIIAKHGTAARTGLPEVSSCTAYAGLMALLPGHYDQLSTSIHDPSIKLEPCSCRRPGSSGGTWWQATAK